MRGNTFLQELSRLGKELNRTSRNKKIYIIIIIGKDGSFLKWAKKYGMQQILHHG